MIDQNNFRLNDMNKRAGGQQSLLNSKRTKERDNQGDYKNQRDIGTRTPEASMNLFSTPNNVNFNSENKNLQQVGTQQKYSSKSLKYVASSQETGAIEKLIQDAFNNTHIYSQSKQPSKPQSHLSAASKTAKSKLIVSPYISLKLNNNSKEVIDAKVILKVIGGSLIAFGFGFSLAHYETKEFQSLFVPMLKHKEKIATAAIILASVLVVAYIAHYINNQIASSKKSKESAEIFYRQLIGYCKRKYSENLQCHLEEDEIIRIIAEENNSTLEDVRAKVYIPYLKHMLESNVHMEAKELVHEGDIKLYWIYEPNINSS